MLEFLARPIRSALGVAEYQATRPVQAAEHEIAQSSGALHRVADSIERHIEVVEGLARSVGPLTESVNQLTQTMADLVALLSPMAAAERQVQQVERLFGFRRRRKAPASVPAPPTDT
jgi:hypothetical protein